LDERQARRLLAIGRTACRQDESAVLADALAELVEQARLAHARLGHNIDDVKLAACLDEAAFQNFHFALTPDVRAEAATDRGLKTCRSLPNGSEPIGFLRLGFALDDMFAGEARIDQALQQPMRRLA